MLPLADERAPTRPTSEAKPTKSPTPLAHMLAVMRDENADPKRRDAMAIAAAQYVHRRPADVGKKERRNADAKSAATGRFAPPAPPKLVIDNGKE
jgi:phage terminase small subunit